MQKVMQMQCKKLHGKHELVHNREEAELTQWLLSLGVGGHCDKVTKFEADVGTMEINMFCSIQYLK